MESLTDQKPSTLITHSNNNVLNNSKIGSGRTFKNAHNEIMWSILIFSSVSFLSFLTLIYCECHTA